MTNSYPTATFAACRPVEEVDPEMADIVRREKRRQAGSIELVASENFASRAVTDILGSCLTNKYAKEVPGVKRYEGTAAIDDMELLVRKRALKAYGLDSTRWGVNVRPHSGTAANFAMYAALLKPEDRIMGLDVCSGGHPTHHFERNATSSIYYESRTYHSKECGYLDYEALEEEALDFRPKLLLCGHSAYPRNLDFARLRAIADACGAWLLCDMAHISGLVAAGEASSPFPYCDFVTSTTHKTLRGPRQGMIFYRRDAPFIGTSDWEQRINEAIYPGSQGAPHLNTMGALGVALKEAMTPRFKAYCTQMRANARAMAAELMRGGLTLLTDGTDNHLVVADLRPLGISAAKAEKLLDMVGMTVTAFGVPGDAAAAPPRGIRIGTPAMTSRGLRENDFVRVAGFVTRTIDFACHIQRNGGEKLKDFVALARKSDELASIRDEVTEFAEGFPMPGGDM